MISSQLFCHSGIDKFEEKKVEKGVANKWFGPKYYLIQLSIEISLRIFSKMIDFGV